MPFSRRAVVSLLTACVFLSAWAQPVLASSGPSGNSDPALERQLLAAVNADRAAQGLPSLAVDPKLTAVARQRAQSMLASGVFSHCIGGDDPCPENQLALPGVLRQAGVPNVTVAENLALSDDLAQPEADVINGLWMESDSHRSFILGQGFNATGLGVICCGTVSVQGAVFTNAVIVAEIFDQYPLATLAALPSGLQGVTTVSMPSTGACQFTLGFKTLHDLVPIDIGTCTDVEAHDPTTGDGVQHSTNGVLVWRKADDRLAFTNGAWTWILGPRGLVHRQNNERFAWEPNPEGFSIVAGGS